MKLFKKPVAFLVSLSFLVAILFQMTALSAFAANNGFSLSASSVQSGGLIQVKVSVESGRGITAFQLRLQYDETMLHYESGTTADCGGVAVAHPTNDGYVNLVFATAQDDIQTGGEAFCTIVFKITDGAVGSSTISLDVLEAIDANDNPINGLSADSLSITVTPTALQLASLPNRRFYFCGTPLDLTGLNVQATYPGGAQGQITDFNLSGFDSTTPGDKLVTIRSGNLSVNFTLKVIQKGDVDANNAVNTNDYQIILQQAVQPIDGTDEEAFFRMDVNGDGAVDAFDTAYEDLLLNGYAQ